MDASQGRLTTADGRVEALRPKTWEVLLVLLANRHRIVSKEELLETIWGDVVVDDDTLVQSVGDIRKALGDDSRNPRFVRTIPRVGYRFIAEAVEEAPLVPPGPSVVAVEEVTTSEVEVEIEYEESPSAPSVPALPAAPRPRRLGIYALALVLAAAGAIYALRRPPITTSLASVPGRTPIAVLLFENQSKSAELDWLRAGLTDMVNADLSASGRLNVLSRQQLDLLLSRLGAAPGETFPLEKAVELARRSRAEAFVLGSFTRLGDSVRINAQLHDAESGALLAAESATAERPELIFGQVDALAGRLLSHFGGAPNVTPAPGLAVAMTGNLPAYRLYSLALEKSEALHNREAIELLEKAVSLDPDFAMAHARIGYTYAVRWADPERGRPYLEKAFKLSGRLTEKDRAHISAWYAIANLDFPAAIGSYQQLVRDFPSELEAYVRLVSLLIGEERHAEALTVARRGLEIDPESRDLHNQLAGIYGDMNRFEQALAAARRYVELAPEEPNAYDTLGGILNRFGRYEEAIAAYGEALRRKPDFEIAVVHLGNTYYAQGRYREALEQFRRYIEIVTLDGERRRGHASIAIVRLRRGELREAERESAKSEPNFSVTALLVALEKRDLASARQIQGRAAEFDRTSTDRGKRRVVRGEIYGKAMLALRTGDTEAALDLFREALRHRPPAWNLETYEDGLANALLSLSRYDEAIAEYERVLRLNARYPLVRYRLGLAYQGKGDLARARAEYRRFLDDWKGADADLPEVRDARARLGGA